MEKLSSLGWNISNSGYALLSENGDISNVNTIAAKALNVDIRNFGEAVLSSVLKQNKTDKVILQIQKIRNVAAPKSKEDSQFAPRMLKFILTDGHTTCQAIEVANISFLSRTHTPPGSKLLINGAKIISSYILLEPTCCQLLGGRVPALCEKWELDKNFSLNMRSVGSDGPPPWINFGEKVITPTLNEPFKALVDKTASETTNEFDLHRQDAISSATTGAVKKVFGGGKQPPQFNNLVKQQRRFNDQDANKYRNTRGSRGKADHKEKIEKQQKPQEKVSLFDFLEDKLPANEIDDKTSANKFIEKDNTKYNNFNKVQSLNSFSSNYDSKPTKDTSYSRKSIKYSYTNNQSSNVAYYTPHSSVPIKFQSQNDNQDNNVVKGISKNMAKLSFDNNFASRSLRQHLNLCPNKLETDKSSSNEASSYNWKVGDFCMAKYWEDGKYYNAVISNLTDKTCVVTFNGYGNVEEVLKADCIPLDVEGHTSSNMSNGSNYKGSRQYRNNTRTYGNKPFNSGNQYYKI